MEKRKSKDIVQIVWLGMGRAWVEMGKEGRDRERGSENRKAKSGMICFSVAHCRKVSKKKQQSFE